MVKEIFKAPPYKSSVNEQVERFQSTLAEIMRCLKKKQNRNIAHSKDNYIEPFMSIIIQYTQSPKHAH